MRQKSAYLQHLICVAMLTCLSLSGPARADFVFGEATNLGRPVNSPYADGIPSISADGLELHFCSKRPGGSGGYDLWATMREKRDGAWGDPFNLGASVNSSADDYGATISADGMVLYFTSNRAGGLGQFDIWMSRREEKYSAWGEPVNLGPTVNSSSWDDGPSISTSGLELFFHSQRSGGYGSDDVWVARRPTTSDPWGQPINLGPTINSSSWDLSPHIAPDGLMLLFAANRTGSYGSADIWMAFRPTPMDSWQIPVNLGPAVNSSSWDADPDISADGSTLYFCDFEIPRPGGQGNSDIWQAAIIPIVDFSGDGKVDGREVLTMTEYWGAEDPVCDIGPMPWGDGVVDVEDLKVLAEYIGKDVIDGTLVAHWSLDEAEGDVAYDSVGDNDGVLMGDPLWEPEGGMVGGALQFDGLDDCIETPYVLNPSDGPFSLLAWVRGGTPGQLIVSQQGGANWLVIRDDGVVATEPSGPGANDALISGALITDGEWHRVGLTWERPVRTLYVDGIAAAVDTSHYLSRQDTILYIGAAGPGNRRRAATFFTGLIDDVRIYNRAVRP